MPLNTLRLNHLPSSHPNDRVVFIKPLKRPPERQDEYLRAEKILKAVAAQALPIMKDNHLSVTTLEEHEPNREFVGRNWNNGQTIELCLQSMSGAWLPLRMIEGVFMHELAHCTVMSHSQAFWKLRNKYCQDLKGLWSRGYTGDGFWSSGRVVGELEQDIAANAAPAQDVEGLEICGGTFRSRRRKRKAKEELTWKEKRDNRIEKKFGKNGETLGADEDKALALAFKTKGPLGTKSRVAQSKRGRELRAAAALARFSTNKKEVEAIESAKAAEENAESEEEYEETDETQADATYSAGCIILDAKGQPVVRASDDDKGSMEDRKQEKEDFADFMSTASISQHKVDQDFADQQTRVRKAPVTPRKDFENTEMSMKPTDGELVKMASAPAPTRSSHPQSEDNQATGLSKASTDACPICSMINEPLQATCVACSHVLDTRKDSRAWKCQSKTCHDSQYMNSGDVVICGICGARKESTPSPPQTVLSARAAAGSSSHIAYL